MKRSLAALSIAALSIAAVCLTAAGAALAQGIPSVESTMTMPNYSTLQSTLEGRDTFGSPESPAVRREKLARAIALRDEALVLEARDGGRLSSKSEAYLRRKARAILAYR